MVCLAQREVITARPSSWLVSSYGDTTRVVFHAYGLLTQRSTMNQIRGERWSPMEAALKLATFRRPLVVASWHHHCRHHCCLRRHHQLHPFILISRTSPSGSARISASGRVTKRRPTEFFHKCVGCERGYTGIQNKAEQSGAERSGDEAAGLQSRASESTCFRSRVCSLLHVSEWKIANARMTRYGTIMGSMKWVSIVRFS